MKIETQVSADRDDEVVNVVAEGDAALGELTLRVFLISGDQI